LEWGAKHTCQSCGAKFYDLQRSPIVCPRCSTEFSAEVLQRGRRPRPVPVKAAAEKPAKKSAAPVEPEETEDLEEPEGIEDIEGIEDEADPEDVVTADEELEDDPADGAASDLIEDVSELGEDDDVPGVVAGDDETER
jgi:uncharacterized protein (TIGR02300 family)